MLRLRNVFQGPHTKALSIWLNLPPGKSHGHSVLFCQCLIPNCQLIYPVFTSSSGFASQRRSSEAVVKTGYSQKPLTKHPHGRDKRLMIRWFDLAHQRHCEISMNNIKHTLKQSVSFTACDQHPIPGATRESQCSCLVVASKNIILWHQGNIFLGATGLANHSSIAASDSTVLNEAELQLMLELTFDSRDGIQEPQPAQLGRGRFGGELSWMGRPWPSRPQRHPHFRMSAFVTRLASKREVWAEFFLYRIYIRKTFLFF